MSTSVDSPAGAGGGTTVLLADCRPSPRESSAIPQYDSAALTSSTSLPVSCDETGSMDSPNDTPASNLEDVMSSSLVLSGTPAHRPPTPSGGSSNRRSSSSASSEHIACQLETNRMRLQLKQLQTDFDNERETVSFLRSKVAHMNKEKVELTSRHNEEVAELLEDSATMRAQLERHEDAQQRHEYELGRAQLKLTQAEQAAAHSEALHVVALAELKGQLSKQQEEAEAMRAALTAEADRVRNQLVKKEAALELCSAERNAFSSEKDELVLTTSEQRRTISDLQQTVQQLQDELAQQRISLGQHLNEAELASDRERKLLEDLEAAERGIKMASELVEEERVAHLESKISGEILQKKFRDLELALAAEMQGKSEAHSKIEQLHGQLRDMEEAYAGERKQNKVIRERLDRSEKELASCQKQLQSEVTDKRNISSNLVKQLDMHDAEMDAIKAELHKAKKKQNLIEEAQVAFVRELEILLETYDLSRDSKVVKDTSSESSVGAMAAVDGIRRLMGLYKNKLEAALDEVRKTRKLCESLAKELTLSKEEIAARDNALEDGRQQLGASVTELNALRMSSSEMEARIAAFKVDVQSLGHELDKECSRNEELNNELTSAIALRKSEEDEHLRYLHGLRQRLSVALTTTTTGGCVPAAITNACAPTVALSGADSSAHAVQATATGAAAAAGGSGGYDKYSWSDVSAIVLEQVIAVLVELNSVREKAATFESTVANREAFIEELQQEHSRLTDRLRAAMEQQASHFMKQKQETDEHHRRTVKEIQHHSKKTLKMADDAWGKIRRTTQVQQELENECADLRVRVSAVTEHHSALHAAFALLAGAYYPLVTRARMLAAQRLLLDDQLRQFEAFKGQACQLLRALMSDDDRVPGCSGGHDQRQRRNMHGSCHVLLRFRVGAVAVIAANRLRRLRLHAGHVLYFADNENVNSALYMGEAGLSITALGAVGAPSSAIMRNGCSVPDECIQEWLTSKTLLNTAVVCMEEVQEVLKDVKDARDGAARQSRLALALISSFKRFSDRLEASFPGLCPRGPSGSSAHHRDRNSLARLLNHGLQAILSRLSGFDGALAAQPAQVILGNLQQRVLGFIQRLHACELDRKQTKQALADAQLSGDERVTAYSEKCRSLQSQVDALLQQKEQLVTAAAYEGLRRELDGALTRERQAQDLLAEQGRQMTELSNKLNADSSERHLSERALRASAQSVSGLQLTLQQKEDDLKAAGQQLAQTEAERRALHTQLYEAERTLQSAARDKESVADYLRGIHIALQQHSSGEDFGRMFSTFGRLSPEVKERGPELVACQKLVTAFVDALQRSQARAASLLDEIALHKTHVARLKDELSAVCRRESSIASGGSFGSRLNHEPPIHSSPYMEDLITHRSSLDAGGSEASFSTSASRSESGHHRRKSGHRRDLLLNGNHRAAPAAGLTAYGMLY